jgi:hypothetical protein
MCRMLYLGADRPLPLIDGTIREPGLRIDPLNPDAEEIIQVLAAMPYRYYVTTESGCACGFHYEDRAELDQTIADYPEPDKRRFRERWEREYQTVHELRTYLAEQRTHGPLLLYHLAQLDRQEDEVVDTPDLTPQPLHPSYFGGDGFALPSEDRVFTILP